MRSSVSLPNMESFKSGARCWSIDISITFLFLWPNLDIMDSNVCLKPLAEVDCFLSVIFFRLIVLVHSGVKLVGPPHRAEERD
jgi:hypothetical protein